MKNFRCACGNLLFFENTRCLQCGRALGFAPEALTLTALEPAGGERWRALHPAAREREYRLCRHYAAEAVCNWLVPAADPLPYCRACRLNEIIPDLSQPRNRVLWERVEAAKRRLLYTLLGLRLPLRSRAEDGRRGLAFEFLADPLGREFSDALAPGGRVLTGHRGGIITLNIAEADPGAREEMRERMNEQYRTLLGHFRHEIGHYYWDRLIIEEDRLAAFRACFGDERTDYDAALARHYASGPPADWAEAFISPYAAAHPWEDWAECWAHYLHIVDTLETAADCGFTVHGARVRSATAPAAIEELLADWSRLALTLNALNRSMGLPDAYPFALSPPVVRKLGYVDAVVRSARAAA